MKSLYFLAFIVLFGSCQKFIEIDNPIDKINASNVFTDDATATSAVLGMYARLVTVSPAFSNGAITIHLGTSADELNYTGSATDMSTFYTNSLNSANFTLYRDFWRYPYETIYHANSCIEGLTNATLITPSLKTQLLGEAYFIRAFCYYYLVNNFGDVPLLTTTDFEMNAVKPRTSTTEVLNLVKEDLKLAVGMLSPTYPSAGRLRANKFTAMALLNRVYLQQQDWEKVEQTADEIITSKVYSLETDLTKTFLKESKEAFWELALPDNNTLNTVEANRFIPVATANIIPTFTLTQSLYNAFENGDLRKTNWVGAKMVNNVTYYYPFKYKVRGAIAKTEHCIVMRLPEIYLNRAEARIHLKDISGALADLNIIRNRANPTWPSFNSTDINVAQNAIQKEKRIEYFAEWGHRWYDLKRSGQLNEVISVVKTNWKETAALFPIPSTEILVNKNLIQNPGY